MSKWVYTSINGRCCALLIRDETIKKIGEFLKEDVTDQFGIKELEAAQAGKTYFYVVNKSGDKVKVENIYNENADVLDYRIIAVNFKLER